MTAISYWSLLATTALKEAIPSCRIKSVLSFGQLCNVQTFEGAVNIVTILRCIIGERSKRDIIRGVQIRADTVRIYIIYICMEARVP